MSEQGRANVAAEWMTWHVARMPPVALSHHLYMAQFRLTEVAEVAERAERAEMEGMAEIAEITEMADITNVLNFFFAIPGATYQLIQLAIGCLTILCTAYMPACADHSPKAYFTPRYSHISVQSYYVYY